LGISEVFYGADKGLSNKIVGSVSAAVELRTIIGDGQIFERRITPTATFAVLAPSSRSTALLTKALSYGQLTGVPGTAD
jgi:hypothetical protein